MTKIKVKGIDISMGWDKSYYNKGTNQREKNSKFKNLEQKDNCWDGGGMARIMFNNGDLGVDKGFQHP